MVNLLEILLPTCSASIRELARKIACLEAQISSNEFFEGYQDCCDLSDLGNDPDIGFVVHNLERYVPEVCEDIEPTVIGAIGENEPCRHALRLGMRLCEGIYPHADAHHFCRLRQNPLWVRWRQGEKAIRLPPPEYELVRVPVEPGDVPPRPAWPEQLQTLLSLFNCTVSMNGLFEIEAQCSTDRFNAINHLAEEISLHLRKNDFGTNCVSETAKKTDQFVFSVRQLFLDNSTHQFVINDVPPNADRRDPSESEAPPSKSAESSTPAEVESQSNEELHEIPLQGCMPKDPSSTSTDLESQRHEIAALSQVAGNHVDKRTAAAAPQTVAAQIPTDSQCVNKSTSANSPTTETPPCAAPIVTEPRGNSAITTSLPPQNAPLVSPAGLSEPQLSRADESVSASDKDELPPWKEWRVDGCIVHFGDRVRSLSQRMADLLKEVIFGGRLHTTDEISDRYYCEDTKTRGDRRQSFAAAISKLNRQIRIQFEGLPSDFNAVHRADQKCRGGDCLWTISMPSEYPRKDPPDGSTRQSD